MIGGLDEDLNDDWIGTSINVWRIPYHNVIGKSKTIRVEEAV
jgi:hypothetical protein